MLHMWFILADVFDPLDQRKHDASVSALWWGMGIIAVVIIGGAWVMMYRRNLMKKETPEEAVGFGLSDLRAMRDRGELSSEEFEAARAKIAAKLKEKAGLAEGELTLTRIGEMLDSGELTAEQYQTERKKIIERLKGRSST